MLATRHASTTTTGAQLAFGLLALLSFAAPSAARAAEVPELRGHVNDYAQILPPERAQSLEARLTEYERRTGQQFGVLTISTLEGDSIEDFGIRVADRWKLGSKEKDEGLILIVVPNDRKMRIEVGYGLEGVVPDAIASRVVREILQPAFRQNDYAGGIDSAMTALMRHASGEEVLQAPQPASERRVRRTLFGPILLPLLLFFLFSMLSGGGRRGRRRRGGFYVGPPMGGFGGGGFGGGGGGGGGFRGGGGGFGGGGASGSW